MSQAAPQPYGSRSVALVLLALPVAVFLLLFIVPIGSIFSLSVDNSAIGGGLSSYRSAAGTDPDPDERAKALHADLGQLSQQQLGEIARLLNAEKVGFRSLILNTGKSTESIVPTMAGFIAFDPKWGDETYWKILSDNSGGISWRYYQKIVGLKKDSDGSLIKGDYIYLKVIARTLVMSLQVTILTLLIGYPLAFAVANGTRATAAIVMTLVLVGFWTSVLVRTTAWVVLLQTNGILNSMMIWLGLVSEPMQLIFNRFGALVAMTHVLLPFAIIPMINVMKVIQKSQSDASRSLGAGPIETFLRVYLPQSLRGVVIGGGTVFILSLGFYITPALTGGPNDQMVSYFIADFVSKSLNWGMASALSVVLLALVAVIFLIFKTAQVVANKRARSV